MAFSLLPEVETDLDDIWLYIAQRAGSIETANRVIDTITDRFWLLGQRPHLGRSRENDLGKGLRSFSVGEYIILYRVEGEDAVILHVYRGSRDIEGIVRENE